MQEVELIEPFQLWWFIFMKQFLKVYQRRSCGRFKVGHEILTQLEEVMRTPLLYFYFFDRALRKNYKFCARA